LAVDMTMMINSTQLRVLLVTARYFPYIGGIETHTHEVARRLARNHVDVTVLTSDPSGKLPTSERREGVTIRRVKAWPADKDYYFAPGVGKVIAEGQWDVIHSQGCHTFVPPLAMLAARRAKIPYVVTFHTGGHSSRLRNMIRGLQWTIIEPLLVRAERWIGVSQYEANYFGNRLRLPDDRLVVIPNGSDLPELAEPVAVQPGLIISVGRLEKFKGHQRVIAALPKVREQCPGARLLILGSGPYEAELRELVEQLDLSAYVEIRSIPPNERQRMAATLAQASLVVLLSEAESHPVAVMEALLLKRPVLVADTSGLSELAQRKLVRAIPLEASAEEAAAAIVEELNAPFVQRDVTLPTWDDCADRLHSLYQTVADERPLCAA
jgi:glycosyltransferase involved in cell wall biosynthesis